MTGVFGPFAHVVMAFADLRTCEFSKDVTTFAFRFLYGSIGNICPGPPGEVLGAS